ncbi:MAG TPA: hypothetical protein IAA79_07915 [Candidatus Avirikenella pullistercoris]|nr:hypothetical protein [Candidatus Avirikenella pullistercoris]
MNSCWQRIEAIIQWAGMTTHAFALHIGLNRSENLYRIKRGYNGISKELADQIVKKYPEIDKLWLLTGERSMFNTPKNKELEKYVYPVPKGIPFYKGSIPEIINNQKGLKPSFYIDLPIIKECDLAVSVNSDAMEPLIPYGSIITLKKINPNLLFFGEIYLINTPDFCMIRKIRKDYESEEQIILISENRQQYDDILLKKKDIINLFLVKSVLYNLT